MKNLCICVLVGALYLGTTPKLIAAQAIDVRKAIVELNGILQTGQWVDLEVKKLERSGRRFRVVIGNRTAPQTIHPRLDVPSHADEIFKEKPRVQGLVRGSYIPPKVDDALAATQGNVKLQISHQVTKQILNSSVAESMYEYNSYGGYYAESEYPIGKKITHPVENRYREFPSGERYNRMWKRAMVKGLYAIPLAAVNRERFGNVDADMIFFVARQGRRAQYHIDLIDQDQRGQGGSTMISGNASISPSDWYFRLHPQQIDKNYYDSIGDPQAARCLGVFAQFALPGVELYHWPTRFRYLDGNVTFSLGKFSADRVVVKAHHTVCLNDDKRPYVIRESRVIEPVAFLGLRHSDFVLEADADGWSSIIPVFGHLYHELVLELLEHVIGSQIRGQISQFYMSYWNNDIKRDFLEPLWDMFADHLDELVPDLKSSVCSACDSMYVELSANLSHRPWRSNALAFVRGQCALLRRDFARRVTLDFFYPDEPYGTNTGCYDYGKWARAQFYSAYYKGQDWYSNAIPQVVAPPQAGCRVNVEVTLSLPQVLWPLYMCCVAGINMMNNDALPRGLSAQDWMRQNCQIFIPDIERAFTKSFGTTPGSTVKSSE